MEIKSNQDLFGLNTFKIKSTAKYFAVIKDIDELKQAVDFAKQNQLPVFVLGGGSNILLPDKGVNGLVIKMEIKGIIFSLFSQDFPEPDFSTAQLVEPLKNPAQENCNNQLLSKIIQVTAFAGENWDDLVKQTVEKGLYGLENLSYIPGTVGASVVQNIEAYGGRVQDTVNWVEVFDIRTGKIKKLMNKDCKFGYKQSIFKNLEGKNLIVIRVAYNLKTCGELQTEYKSIQQYLKENNTDVVSVYDVREAVVNIRKKKFTDFGKVGMVGSFFKNPTVNSNQLKKLQDIFPDLPYYSCDKKFLREKNIKKGTEFKIALAFVLDKLGWKGYQKEGAGVHKDNPLILVNYGKSTSKNIRKLSNKIIKEVKQKTGLDIDFEVVEW